MLTVRFSLQSHLQQHSEVRAEPGLRGAAAAALPQAEQEAKVCKESHGGCMAQRITDYKMARTPFEAFPTLVTSAHETLPCCCSALQWSIQLQA